jgi:hypothetical protein
MDHKPVNAEEILVWFEDGRKRRRAKQREINLAIVPICILLTVLLYAFLGPFSAGGMLLAVCASSLILFTAVNRAFLLREQFVARENGRILSAYDDMRMVGPLIDALGIRDTFIRTPAINTLTKLLPRLHATDAQHITALQMWRLCDALKYNSYEYSDSFTRAFDAPIIGGVVDRSELLDFHLAILKALEQIGDETAIPHVSAIIEQRVFREADKILRDAAVECYPTLIARVEENRPGSMLLRPSTGLDRNGETLLRPARQGEVHLEFLLHVPEEEEEKADP